MSDHVFFCCGQVRFGVPVFGVTGVTSVSRSSSRELRTSWYPMAFLQSISVGEPPPPKKKKVPTFPLFWCVVDFSRGTQKSWVVKGHLAGGFLNQIGCPPSTSLL